MFSAFKVKPFASTSEEVGQDVAVACCPSTPWLGHSAATLLSPRGRCSQLTSLPQFEGWLGPLERLTNLTVPPGVETDLCLLAVSGVNSLSQSLSANPLTTTTLSHLDLSGNVLRGDDLSVGFPSFLQQPSSVSLNNDSGTLSTCDSLAYFPAPPSRGVQPVAHGLHVAQEGYEWGPT